MRQRLDDTTTDQRIDTNQQTPMKKGFKFNNKNLSLWTYLAALLWSAVFIFSLQWNLQQNQRMVPERASAQARAAIEKDMIYRSVVSRVGGIYMPVDQGIIPNPYLAHLPDRDVTTTDGRKLTLVNSSYFTRLVHDQEAKMAPDGVRGHTTKENPLRPLNAPDSWELRGLKKLRSGLPEWSEETLIDGKPYLRMIKPRLAKASCMNCHPEEIAAPGEIMGGISVRIPLDELQAQADTRVLNIAGWHGGLWILGMIGLFLGNRLFRIQSEKMQYSALHDILTDLPNRALFMDRLEQRLENAKRHELTGAILFLDLDRFKYINDSLGHSIGDELLKLVAERQRFLLRAEDTVARLGGDEFVILLAELHTDPEITAIEAQNVAEKVLNALAQPYQIGNHTLHSTPSIGIALISPESDNASEILRQADAAMYQAKEYGRNNFRFFLPSMQMLASERLELENALHSAITQNQLVLHYQPKVAISRREEILGAEALIRWQHPTQGLLLPGEFIAIAEESGLILQLGEWVLREACLQIKAWQHRFKGKPFGRISVNISPKQFQQKDFIQQIISTITDTEVDPTGLELELTESSLVEDVHDVRKKMVELKKLGIQISIDDFGTGYSSLAYLKMLPVDVLKIDRSFIRDIGIDPNDDAIVETILAMSWRLGFRAIAEGVETEEQLKFLRARQCDGYQGYLFSRPLVADGFEAILLNSADRRA
ncbi:MAG: EAL domain-containing protein [Candidatus Thiodiazotropha taylori]|nr:EAL domain-containing protein [Candidatus Thiodiazotropha taylori]MCG8033955.1 EAL domain-containing protein [Candidatus Thiodiazotropha taylori]MCW4261295.1 EAL domain-containing protein [Candidatus Thiodiazotropha endolucinida]